VSQETIYRIGLHEKYRSLLTEPKILRNAALCESSVALLD
jgi:hypothetical protein